jgi:hypothetical protein
MSKYATTRMGHEPIRGGRPAGRTSAVGKPRKDVANGRNGSVPACRDSPQFFHFDNMLCWANGRDRPKAVSHFTTFNTLENMTSTIHARKKWWLGFLISSFLPFWILPFVLNFGGWIVPEVGYSSFKVFAFLCCVFALYSTFRFLRTPDEYFGLRFAIGAILGLFLSVGALASIGFSTCEPETIRLGKMWSSESTVLAEIGGCSAMSLTSYSIWTF